jgi:NAD-dependent dihydropyrimidine dehydrogenase PreA subunit
VVSLLSTAGWNVHTLEVRAGTPNLTELPAGDLLVLACPTLGFSAPASFRRWVSQLPRAQGTPVALLAVCGGMKLGSDLVAGHSGGVHLDLIWLLQRKGFRVTHEADVSYPENWTQVAPPPGPDAQTLLIAQGDRETDAFASALLSQVCPLRRSLAVSLPLAGVGVLFRVFARRFLAKLYVADSACTACGLCQRVCPAGAIVWKAGRPRWSLRCDACNRCINLCPTKAIQVSWLRLAAHGGLQIALTVGAVALLLGPWGAWALLAALCLWLVGTAAELGPLEVLLGWAEGRFGWAKAGPTQSWGRYRAPGFKP